MLMTTLYSAGKDLKRTRRNLEMNFMIIHQWFHENHIILNPGKFHYIVIGSRDLSHEIMRKNDKITSSNEENLLGIQTKFWKAYRLLLQKSRPKNALARLKNNLTSDQRNLLFNCHKVSVYLLPSDMDVYVTLSNALNDIHERALRLIYNDHEKLFNSNLTENNLKTIHQKTLEFLAVKIYKFQNGLPPPIMNGILFSRQNIYNPRKIQEPKLKTLWISVQKSLIEAPNSGT